MAVNMKLRMILSLSLAALTTAQQTAQCGETRCGASNNNSSWMSNITFTRMVTSARLDWLPDLMLNDGSAYRVAIRNVSAGEAFTRRSGTIRGPTHPNTAFTVNNLLPSTSYEALVCLPRFNISTDIPPADKEPFIPQCGFCVVCFKTLDLNFEFLPLSASVVNETYVNLTCPVEANVPFSVVWSVEIGVDPNTGTELRVELVDGGGIDGEQISITDDLVVLEDGTDFVITSVLIAPDAVLDMNVECIANSSFGSSESRRFSREQLNDGATVTFTFPLWVISILIVVPLLITTCLIVVAAVYCRKQKKITKEVIKLRKLKSNDYLESHYTPPVQKPAYSSEPEISELDTMLPEEMIIDSSLVNVSTVIGQGEFGVVYKGMLRRGSVSELVAVKSLKGIFVSENDVQNALKEISKMKNFDHPNVMTLVGVCKATAMSGGAPSIIMPYMARGSLLGYLRKDRDAMLPGEDADITQTGAVQKLLMQICFQISKGMAYLASLRFVHRDLAARNCMIDEKGVIKVADFGLAEDVYMRNYFRQTSQDAPVKLPLKWMAPESIKLGIFSEKSDVWSYGVTCWEVFTAGEIPYPGVHPREVVELLEDGQHLNRPKNPALSDTMYSLMNSCWRYRPEDRPEFEELVSSLNKELTTLADYIDLTMFAEENNVNTASEE